jgi:hypothetical protein
MDNDIAGRIATAILCIGATSALVLGASTQDVDDMEVAAKPSWSPETTPSKSESPAQNKIERKERTPIRATPTLKSAIKKIRKPVSIKKPVESRKPVHKPRQPKPPTKPYTPKKSYSGVKEWARQQVGDVQFRCLDKLFTRESGWNTYATNPSSGAYGIPQSLPASKMASAGADWKTNPFTQVRWGLNYIANRYGSPCGAWAHSQSVGWY